jgi:hypothetical protein
MNKRPRGPKDDHGGGCATVIAAAREFASPSQRLLLAQSPFDFACAGF